MQGEGGSTGLMHRLFGPREGVRCLAIVGFASMLLVSMIASWASASGLAFGYVEPGVRSYFSGAQDISFSCCFFVLFLAFARSGRRWPANNIPLALVMGGLFLAVGSLLAAFVLGGVRAPWVTRVAGGAMGAALALGYVLWQQVFSLQENRSGAIEVVLGSAVAGGLFFVVTWFPPEWALGLTAVLAAVTCVLLVGFFSMASEYESETRGVFTDARSSVTLCIRENWAPVLVMSLLGLAWGVFATLAARQTVYGYLSNLYALGRMFAAALAFAYFASTRFSCNLNVFPQVIFPVCITAALLYPLLGKTIAVAIATIYYVVFGMMSIAMIVACADMARRYRLHPSAVYCLFFGFIYLFSKIGLFVGRGITASAADVDSLTFELFVALTTVYAFAMMSFFIQKRRRARSGASPAEKAQGGVSITGFKAASDAPAVPKMEPVKSLGNYGLTPRECQVATLLAKGRDIPYICEELSLSKNTVRTHIRNVYQKVGVHGKQELISLIEDDTEAVRSVF